MGIRGTGKSTAHFKKILKKGLILKNARGSGIFTERENVNLINVFFIIFINMKTSIELAFSVQK